MLKNGARSEATSDSGGSLSPMTGDLHRTDLQRDRTSTACEFGATGPRRKRGPELEKKPSLLPDSRCCKFVLVPVFVLALVTKGALLLSGTIEGLTAAHEILRVELVSLSGRVQNNYTIVQQVVQDILTAMQQSIDDKLMTAEAAVQANLTVMQQTVDDKLTTMEARVADKLALVVKTVEDKLARRVRVPVQCPLGCLGSLNGTIAYLTRKYGGKKIFTEADLSRSRLLPFGMAALGRGLKAWLILIQTRVFSQNPFPINGFAGISTKDGYSSRTIRFEVMR
jgi:hypothetical protein